jgi:micrococcal nuclease
MRFGRRGPSLGAILLLAIAVAALLGADCSGKGGEDTDGALRGDRVRAEVERVVDGDTIEVEIGGETEDVRYIGIDTPESVAPGQPVECFGKAASAENERLVEGELVLLVFDAERRDDYDRLLAYVYVGNTFVNAALVADGYARTLEIEPNTSKAARLERLEAEAGREGVGLWSACAS